MNPFVRGILLTLAALVGGITTILLAMFGAMVEGDSSSASLHTTLLSSLLMGGLISAPFWLPVVLLPRISRWWQGKKIPDNANPTAGVEPEKTM